jgi:hypothetical protein
MRDTRIQVTIEGLPSYDKAYPTADELKSLLNVRSGLPVSMQVSSCVRPLECACVPA